MPTRKDDIDADGPTPQQPPDEPSLPSNGNGNGNGNGGPHPSPVSIIQISPIGGALAGGIDVTLTGTGFQPTAEVFFGSSPSPDVTFISATSVKAKLPPATQIGSVSVTLINPDSTSATQPGGFTYVTTEASLHAEVLGVTPLSVIEDTESEVTIRGRNLIAAFNDGMVVLRGSSRVHIMFSNSGSSRDETTGIESLTLTVRLTATPPLEQHERMAIQVLASIRPGAANDGVFETSRQMFTMLPRAVPVLLAYSADLTPGKPNLVLVAGRNLQGCSLAVGEGPMVHLQSGDDETLAGIVSLPAVPTAPTSFQLSVLDPTGSETGRLDMRVAPSADTQSSTTAASSPGEARTSNLSQPTDGEASQPVGGDLGLTLTPVPGQQLIGPTKEDSAVFGLNGQALFPAFTFDEFEFVIYELDIIIPLFNEVRLIPFFDNGAGDLLNNTPVLAEVGQLLRLRGVGLLVALRVELIIHIEVVLIIGFIFDIWPFGVFNEFFDDYPWAIGSIVISIQVIIEVFFQISFLLALALPGGQLRVLLAFNLALGIDFTIDSNGHLQFDTDFTYRVSYFRVGPVLNNPLPCEGRFQLAEDNGQNVFTDSFGGQISFYFPRAAGQCCIPWDFNLQLVRFTEGGSEEAVQDRFQAEFCLNALDSANQVRVVVVSDRTPDGFPPPLDLDVHDTSMLRAMFRQVDSDGHPLPGSELQDVRDFGYQVEFYLETPPDVLDPESLRQGTAWALTAGNNIIHARLFKADVVIVEPGVESPSFWPGDVLGFDILSFLARGQQPAIRSGALPVIVNAPAAGEIVVDVMIVYRDEKDSTKLIPVTVLERNEPFDPQRQYLLAAKLSLGSGVQPSQKLTFTVDSLQMAAPLAGLPFGRNRLSNEPRLFFTGELALPGHQGTIDLNSSPDTSKPIVVSNLTIAPNNIEIGPDTGALSKLVPPGHAVTNRDTSLSIKLTVTSDDSSTTVRLKNPLPDLTVSNDETFEEYLRVFQEVQKIMLGSNLENFEVSFDADLPDQGIDLDKLKTYLNTQGKTLWDAAVNEMKTRKDDRPLYWTRLKCVGALRAYCRRKGLTKTQVEDLIPSFEWRSRGLDASGRIVFDDAPLNSRKVIVTGFDPFGLPSAPDQSNPSGLIALEFNKGSVGASQPPTHIRTAIFPVRYKEFDAGLIETSIEQSIGFIVMLVTTSENGGIDTYDIERWAGKNRIATLEDNNNLLATGTPVRSDLRDPGGATAYGDQFLETTLPYEQVITTDPATHTLRGPNREQTPFVIDQSYKVIATNATTFKAGEFRPRPNEHDPNDTSGFIKVADRPDSSKGADEGSGGNYLSNEIFYRTAFVRNSRRQSLASGHFHVPFTGTVPQTTGPKLLDGVRVALGKFVDNLSGQQPRIVSVSPTSGRPGITITITGERFDGTLEVRIGGVSVPFRVPHSAQIKADVTTQARTGYVEVETPYGTAISPTLFFVVRRFPRELLSASLKARRSALGLTRKAAAQQMGVKAGTYANWEQGRDEPRVSSFPAIINFLGDDPEPEAQPLSEQIRAARQKQGLSQRQLAEQLGIAPSTVKAWEEDSVGRPTPRITHIFEEYVKDVQ